ncbi:MAG: ATP-dependent DNA helicase RecG [Candidatus Spechtbacteria bacterium]|nr:ATP-dependent DNA helicase RecG [Candidatus Spechtbacteria bacterium]
MRLDTPIEQLERIGPIYRARLHKLGIKTIGNLLFHIPHRYQDYSQITPIRDATLNDIVTVQGKILSIEASRTWKKHLHLTEAIIQDETSAIKAVWFNQPYLSQNLKEEMYVLLSGKVTLTKDSLCLSSPVYEILGDGEITKNDTLHTGRLVPIYPETAGLSSRWLRYVIHSLLPIADNIPDYLPDEILRRQDIPELARALKTVHFPHSLNDAERAKKRLAFGELFLIQTVALKEKYRLRQEHAPQITTDVELAKKFVASLPYALTDSQRATTWEILQDMEKPYPMNRLLEGDVGSGKTVVAAFAAMQAINAGYQVAFMVPTEILAEQHFRALTALLCNKKTFAQPSIAALTSSSHKKTSRKISYAPFVISKERVGKETLAGDIDIVVGTHALIQETVKFKNLGLIIIDEQHRFGVEQRAALARQKDGPTLRENRGGSVRPAKIIPHLLSMTATPIPRTLSLTIFGDLDLSLIKQFPKGRKQIISKLIPPADRYEAYRFIESQIHEGRQAFVICPLIDESDKLDAKAATKEFEKLQKEIFPHLKIALIHGKMKGKEKEKIMQSFKEKEADILVATSVVEVGIDVPNASVMIIEGADRFGLAQLYQFRGRVGRGEHQSYCFLFTDSSAKTTSQRLKALLTAKNSFELAEKDLEIRGPGDFIGSRQSGIPDLAMASLTDFEFVKEVRKEVESVLTSDPELKNNHLLRERYENFRREIHFE